MPAQDALPRFFPAIRRLISFSLELIVLRWHASLLESTRVSRQGFVLLLRADTRVSAFFSLQRISTKIETCCVSDPQ